MDGFFPHLYGPFSRPPAGVRGPIGQVALAVRAFAQKRSPNAGVLIFDDETGCQLDFDLRGLRSGTLAGRGLMDPERAMDSGLRFGGQGASEALVWVAREVTLLASALGMGWRFSAGRGRSVALRKLVEGGGAWRKAGSDV